MLFANQRKHEIKLPQKDEKGDAVNIAYLVNHLCEQVMQDSRKELFVLDGTV